MNEERPAGLGRSTAVMAAGTATSRVLGLVRASVLVLALGMNAAAADAFQTANWLPNMLYMLIAGGVLNAVLVPQVVRAYRSADGQSYVDRLLSLSVVLLFGLTALLTLCAPLIVRLAVSDKEPGFVALATLFALWCVPQVFFYGLYTLLGQVLNARGNFGPYMWAPVVNNVVAIGGLVVFIAVFGRQVTGGTGDDLSIWGASRVALLAGTATLGVVAQALVLLVPLYRSGFRFHPRRDWRGTGLGTTGRVAGWAFGALAVGQVGVLAVVRVANDAAQSGSAAGIAGYNAYANSFLIFMLPHSLITVSLLTALFTRLSDHAAARDTAAVRRDFSYGLRTVSVFTMFAAVALSVLALPIARTIFFDTQPAEIATLPPIIVAFMAGLVALGVWSLCQRVFYAYEDAKGLFWIQVVMAGIVVTGSVVGRLVLQPERWVSTAALSIAASYVVGALWGGKQVWNRLGGSPSRIVRLHVRAGLAALASGALGWGVSRLFGDLAGAGMGKALAAGVVVGAVLLASYLGLLRLLRVSELDGLVDPVLARLRRLRVSDLKGPLDRLLARLRQLRVSLKGLLDRLLARLRQLRVSQLKGLLDRLLARLRQLRTPEPSVLEAGLPEPEPDSKPKPKPEPDPDPVALEGEPPDGVVGRGTLLAGRYRLHQPVPIDLPGVDCWSARDQILDRPVRALVLRSGRIAQAQDAARRAALVRDPRLLRVLDVGDHVGVLYVVTEPVVGQDLQQLTEQGPLPADQARSIVAEAAAALEVARRRGVHHLALRPSAVHVTPDGGVLVTGLALDGELLGHDLSGAKATSRADTVGLVSLLYLALTGRWPAQSDLLPFDGADAAPRVDGSPVAPSELTPGVPNDLDTLCVVTLGPDDDGPHSPAELVRELEPWGPIKTGTASGTLATAPSTTVPSGPWDDGALPDRPVVVASTDAGIETDADAAAGTDRAPEIAPTARPPQASPKPAAPEPQPARRGWSRLYRPAPPPAELPIFDPIASAWPRSGTTAVLPDRDAHDTPDLRVADFETTVQPPRTFVTRRFNPTPYVLGLMTLIVVIGTVLAWNALTRPAPPIGGEGGFDLGNEYSGREEPAPDVHYNPAPEPVVTPSAEPVDPPPDADPDAVDPPADRDPTRFRSSHSDDLPT